MCSVPPAGSQDSHLRVAHEWFWDHLEKWTLESILEPIGFQLKIDLNDDHDYAFRFFISGANNKHTVSPESLLW